MGTTLEVSFDGNSWIGVDPSPPAKVKADSPFSIWFRVETDSTLKIAKLAIPVYDRNIASSNNTQVGEDKSLIDINTWNAMTIGPVSGLTIEKGALGEVNMNGNIPGTLILHFQANSNFNTIDAAAKCSFQAKRGRVWESLGDILIQTFVPQAVPVIRSFTANSYFLPEGDLFPTLFWEIDNLPLDKQIVLKDSAGNRFMPPFGATSFVVPKGPKLDDISYTLTIVDESRNLTIRRHSNSQIGLLKNEPSSDPILGLSSVENKMYALVREGKDDSSNVFLWATENGLDWNKMVLGSNFISLQPELEALEKVPLEMGGSPSLILNNRLYLVGGSKFDMDFVSNAVYGFDLNSSGFIKLGSAAFSPRMGHAIASVGNVIYVLGGCDPTFGALNDVWSFDPNRTQPWKLEVAMKLPQNRCFHNVTVHDSKIYIFGGFTSAPGNADLKLYDALYCYDLSSGNTAKGWVNVKLSADDALINASGLLNLPSHPISTTKKNPDYLFSLFSTKAKKQSQYGFYKWDWSTNNDASDMTGSISGLSDLFVSNDIYYSITTVTFLNVVWICVVSMDKNEQIFSGPLRYFFYAGN